MTERVYFVSLGCPKNWVDSEVMLGYLQRAGYRLVSDPQESSIIIVNTCAFIREAKEEALETILELAQWKKEGSDARRLVVTGCLPQRYREQLIPLLPEVDLFLGPGEIPAIVEHLEGAKENGRGACRCDRPAYLYTDTDPRLYTLPGAVAYVKIAEGCSNRCTYCAVPLIRGPMRSRSIPSIVKEVQGLVAAGIREIVLVAQDTTAFGLDRRREPELAHLLAALDAIDGHFWIRLLYAHPAHLTDELIEAMARSRRLCPYLDLPIQHIHPGILKRMNRRPGPGRVRRLLHELRQAVPGIHLRTSVMVGFPGETEEAFQCLADFVGEARFDWLGVFVYSREEQTAAAAFDGIVPRRTAEQRRRRLLARQREITRASLARHVGERLEVLVEGAADGTGWGRTAFMAPEIDGSVHLHGEALEPGCLQWVRITGHTDYDLKARVMPC
jgi:ribosomal protein S12 methylthiotransferase